MTVPIPEGLTNIRTYDVSTGIDVEIVAAFNSTPDALHEIITLNNLILVKESKLLNEPKYEYFPDIRWEKTWRIYEKSFSDEKIELITIWVNPENDKVLFRLVARYCAGN